MKKILYITPDFYPTNWGYANATTNFIHLLTNNSEKFYFYIFTHKNLISKELNLNNNWEIIRIPYLNIPFKGIISQFYWFLKLRKYIKKVDYIFFETIEFPILILLIFKIFNKNKVIIRIHWTSETEITIFKKWIYNKLLKYLRKKCLLNSNNILSTTKYYFNFINNFYFNKNLLDSSNKKYFTLPNVIINNKNQKLNEENFINNFIKKYNINIKEDKIFITLWRLNNEWFIQKWIEDLLISLSFIKNQINNNKFFIFWKWEKVHYIKSLIKKLWLEKNVYHIEYINNDNLQELMKNSITILLSRFEGQSMFAMEALKNKSILLFSKNWGHSDLVSDWENWYLVNIKDYEDIYKKILILTKLNLKNINKFREKSKYIYKNRYSNKKTLEKFENILNII